jgi:hypothetical protein
MKNNIKNKLTAEQILANQKAYRQSETTLHFEFSDFDDDAELNEFLYEIDEDKAYRCEAYFCASNIEGKAIYQINTANRDDAEKYYDLVSNWAFDNNIYCSRSAII